MRTQIYKGYVYLTHKLLTSSQNIFKLFKSHEFDMDKNFFKRLQEVAKKSPDQYTPNDRLVKHEATLIAAAIDPYVRGISTVIVPKGMTVEDAMRDSYRRDVNENWKKITDVNADDIARGIEGIETKEKLNSRLKTFIKALSPEAKQQEYQHALTKLNKDLYKK
jgi:hypothetical protein